MMLVLTRKREERISITVPPSAENTYIDLTIFEVDRGKVRIGFEAPRKVLIYRTELLTEEQKWLGSIE